MNLYDEEIARLGTRELEEELSRCPITSTTDSPLSLQVENLLRENNLLWQVRFLSLTEYDSRVPIYALCLKDVVKFPDKDSKHYYAWDTASKLWEMEDKKGFAHELRGYIRHIYISVITRISNIHSLEQLRMFLFKKLEKSTMKTKVKDIVDDFIPYVVDKNIRHLLDPPYQIAVKDGKVVNLKTGEIRDRTINDYFTCKTYVSYNVNADMTFVNKYFNDIMLDEQDKVEYLQKILGYAISGDCSKDKMVMFIGGTMSGKTILLNWIDDTLGNEYSSYVHPSLLLGKSKARKKVDPFLADLIFKNRRVAILNTMCRKDVINADKFKSLVKEENIRKNRSKHVLFLQANYEPTFSEDECEEYVLPIHFNAYFTDNPTKPNDRNRVSRIVDELELHREALLLWLVQGAIKYFREND